MSIRNTTAIYPHLRERESIFHIILILFLFKKRYSTIVMESFQLLFYLEERREP